MNVETAYYLSAFSLGILGSFHCAGMCGPLMLMLPDNAKSGFGLFISRIIYNSGRIFTYLLIGCLAGLLGLALSIKGFQRELSIGIGVFILIALLFSSRLLSKIKLLDGRYYSNHLRFALKKLFVRRTKMSFFLIGVLNGLLPCGLVYLAVAGSASAGSLSGSMFYMALFGLGTFPMMMVVSMVANYLGSKFKSMFSKLSLVMTLIIAIILIVRGININSEHCSRIESNNANPVFCHP